MLFTWSLNHRIGWWEIVNWKALHLMVKTMVSCRFSLKPIQWLKNPTPKPEYYYQQPMKSHEPTTITATFRNLWKPTAHTRHVLLVQVLASIWFQDCLDTILKIQKPAGWFQGVGKWWNLWTYYIYIISWYITVFTVSFSSGIIFHLLTSIYNNHGSYWTYNVASTHSTVKMSLLLWDPVTTWSMGLDRLRQEGREKIWTHQPVPVAKIL